MKRITNGFLTALTTLSRIPVPWRFEADYALFGFFLPLMGFLAALPVWAASALSGVVPNALFIVVPAIFVQYWLFNLFHFDGLLDASDALLFQGTRERRLEILKDSSIGTFGLFVGVLYMVAKVALLSMALDRMVGFRAGPRLLLVSISPIAGRLSCACIPVLLRTARPGGLGAILTPYRLTPMLAGWVVSIGGVGLWLSAGAAATHAIGLGSAGIAAAVAAAVVVAWTFGVRVGGFTGDSLGAAVEVGEIFALAGVVVVLS